MASPHVLVQTHRGTDVSQILYLNTESFMNSQTNTTNELKANLELLFLFLLLFSCLISSLSVVVVLYENLSLCTGDEANTYQQHNNVSHRERFLLYLKFEINVVSQSKADEIRAFQKFNWDQTAAGNLLQHLVTSGSLWQHLVIPF